MEEKVSKIVIEKVYPYRSAMLSKTTMVPASFFSSIYNALNEGDRDNHIVVVCKILSGNKWHRLIVEFSDEIATVSNNKDDIIVANCG